MFSWVAVQNYHFLEPTLVKRKRERESTWDHWEKKKVDSLFLFLFFVSVILFFILLEPVACSLDQGDYSPRTRGDERKPDRFKWYTPIKKESCQADFLVPEA